MHRLRALVWRLASPRSRLQDAEQRFFDAYHRGGTLQHRRLVVPMGYFATPEVGETLERWLAGQTPLDLDRLETVWRRGREDEDVALFRGNLAQFLALVAEPTGHRATWTGPKGQLLSPGSPVFD